MVLAAGATSRLDIGRSDGGGEIDVELNAPSRRAISPAEGLLLHREAGGPA
jgi:hypothetical protein